jgi:hypothetical protein
MRKRDRQRSLVYSWEARATKGAHWKQTIKTIEECEEFAKPIWRSERGRYGRAKVSAPSFAPAHWGQTSAIAHYDHRITLPKWARNPWVILHEMAHRLTPKDEAHGSRFVGVLIGLASRHLGMDADELLATAEEMGVSVDYRSVGAVPVIPLWRKLEPALPGTDVELAVELGVSYLQIRGAALHLIRIGRARWAGKMLRAIPPERRVEVSGSDRLD